MRSRSTRPSSSECHLRAAPEQESAYARSAAHTASPKSRYVRDMAPLDRTLAICDLLLGAAHADSNFTDRERATVRELLSDLFGSEELPSEVEARIDLFQPGKFAVDAAA